MRPHVHVNVAMSADGKLSTRERRQVRISGPADFSRVDRIKAESDAVMVGIGTVLADDPSLTVKSPELRAMRIARGMPGNPVRIVVDSMARTPPGASILHKGEGERIIACSERAGTEEKAVLGNYATVLSAGHDRVDLPRLFSVLYERGIRRVMVEGGGTLIAGLFAADLVDELTCFVGNMIIGGSDAPTLADGPGFIDEKDFIRLSLSGTERLDEGILLSWCVTRER
ncbi:MAG: 2,5-diamino-6-(ribosylamino)-4(3H)-pyrimidinone 5'-phosphate reductase [Methanomicrobiales archaeon]|nr:2,5-diamino-6-(ribosylamino)-4(3H)-pyrimidinone 5'-phosphate reductase [Methanomicrobiales archaeon]